ncbi:MAG: hypothetical protein KGM17_12855 [Sphingomonadales bacterium]|nr:hypothetical protein [Sphingomonadales bacterium]
MTKTLTALFDRYEDAEAAVSRLERAGVPQDDISIVAHNGDGRHKTLDGAAASPAAADAESGAEIGAAVGGIGGLLAGLGLLVIPGLGPVAAAGWLGSTILGALGGAVVGGAAGGLVGALTDAGVPEADANVYAEGVRRGGSLVSARVEDRLEDTARAILDGDTSVDLAERGSMYRSEGWTRFDPEAPDYNRAM